MVSHDEPRRERDDPGGERHDDQVLAGEIRQPLRRGLRGLRVPDHGDDASQGRIGADVGRAEPECSLLVSRPAHDLIARALRDRHRLSGKHRFIYVARAFDHDAVHRDGVAGPNRKDVALGDGFEGHFLFLSIPHAPRGGRCELE